MAEEKNKKVKKNNKDKKNSTGEDEWKKAGEVLTVLLVIIILISLFISHFTIGGDLNTATANFQDWFDSFTHENPFGRFIASTLFTIQFLGTYISLVFFLCIVYLVWELQHLHHKEHHMFAPEHDAHISPEDVEKQKWHRIEAHLESENPSDWRLAILEADILLEEKMEIASFLGETLGDKLKNADKTEFPPLDKAWEAHKIRNLIAHEGSNFLISHREAKRVIVLYRDVLDHFPH